jgi:hypothetical protein
VAAGVGFFLVVSFLAHPVGWNLSWLLIGFYIVVFALAAFVPTRSWPWHSIPAA